MRKVAENLERIKQQINDACRNAGRDPEVVKLIAVTKYVSIERAE